MVTSLALPQSPEGRSRSQCTRHSAENQKWGIQERFGSVHGGNFGKRKQNQVRLVELTCQNSTPYIIRRENQGDTQLSMVGVSHWHARGNKISSNYSAENCPGPTDLVKYSLKIVN